MLEERSLDGQIALVTGATKGLGYVLARDFRDAGATVIIGGSNEESVGNAIEQLEGDRLVPFTANLTDFDQIDKAVLTLARTGLHPNIFVHAAAAGLGDVLKACASDLRRLGRIKRGSLNGDFLTNADALKAKSRQLIEADILNTLAVNFTGPVHLVERMSGLLAPDAKLIYLTSLWSSFQEAQYLEFYGGVRWTKGLFEEWMKENAMDLAAGGVFSAIVSGHVFDGGDLGRGADVFVLPLMDEEDRDIFKDGFIPMMVMAESVCNLALSDPVLWHRYPQMRYVYGENRKPVIKDNLALTAPVLQVRYPI